MRVANPKGEALPWGPAEDFGQMIFLNKFYLGFHIFMILMSHGGGETRLWND